MLNITVGKLTRNPIDLSRQIRIDRTTILGNPFFLASDAIDDDQEFNLKIYRIYLDAVLRKAFDPRTTAYRLAESYRLTIPNTWQRPDRQTFLAEFDRLFELAQRRPIDLLCFCAPKRCHGDVLKSAIEWKIRELGKVELVAHL
jgi:Domain of unknown function (DUF4326)